jgi:hypothetical protein
MNIGRLFVLFFLVDDCFLEGEFLFELSSSSDDSDDVAAHNLDAVDLNNGVDDVVCIISCCAVVIVCLLVDDDAPLSGGLNCDVDGMNAFTPRHEEMKMHDASNTNGLLIILFML